MTKLYRLHDSETFYTLDVIRSCTVPEATLEPVDTLRDLTRQESGVVLYKTGEAIVCNWAAEAPLGGLPRLFQGLFLVTPDTELHAAEYIGEGATTDYLSGSTRFIYDPCTDAPALLDGIPCRVWKVDDATVIAPDGWN